MSVIAHSVRMSQGLSGVVAWITVWLGLGVSTCAHAQPASAQSLTPPEIVAELDDPATAWRATAQVQAIPAAALPLLLQPGRVASGPHGRWTPHMLALAKLGEPAIPSIVERAIAILKERESTAFAAAHPLITVLGSLGPAAVPALLQIAETSSNPSVTAAALDAIVQLEPSTSVFGQVLSPWEFWRPADARLDDLRRELGPRLPRLRTLMERELTGRKPQSHAPHRIAAYLLARWGESETRRRGRQVLVALAQADESFYDDLESVRLLHRLRDPEAADLIRRTASRVPDGTDLRAQYLLSMAIALHQLGDRDYAALLSAALRDTRPHVRMDAARFLAASAEVGHGDLLVPLLGDQATWNGRTVAHVALESLRRLTFEPFDADPTRWRTWLEANRHASRHALVARRVRSHLQAMPAVPIWEANRWIDAFAGADGAALLPLVDRYLDRRDLDASAVGPGTSLGGGGSGPIGIHGPRIVTLLLDMALLQVPGALQRLTACLEVADPEVRLFGALALSAFDRRRAVDRLAVESAAPEGRQRTRASEFLLRLGDTRGIPARLEALTSDQEAIRLFACRDLRAYTQMPLPCEADASLSDRAANARAWRQWWERAGPTFRVNAHAAALDLQAFPVISPVTIGDRRVK